MEIDIKLAYDDLENVKLLFNEYTAMLGVNLAFQGYDAEIKNLPGKYAMPSGRLYIAYCGNCWLYSFKKIWRRWLRNEKTFCQT